MVRKTNNYVYAYKLKFPDQCNVEYFRKQFNSKNLTKNLHKFMDSDYFGTLEYAGEYGGGLFFKFSKVDNRRIFITNMKDNIQEFLDSKKYKKHTHVSYFVYYPEKKRMLGLFNNDAMRHIAAPLREYFKEKHNIEIECNFRKAKHDPKSLLSKMGFIRRIMVRLADEDIDRLKDEQGAFGALAEHSKQGATLLVLDGMAKSPIKPLIPLITEMIKKEKPKNVYVKGEDLEVDILKEIALGWDCKVIEDANNFADFDDFKKKADTLYKKYEKLL